VVAGGGEGSTGGLDGDPLSSVEIYDRGLGFDAAWRPQLEAVDSPLMLGQPLHASGAGFRRVSEASAERFRAYLPLVLRDQ
jgi:hypothetical protein